MRERVKDGALTRTQEQFCVTGVELRLLVPIFRRTKTLALSVDRYETGRRTQLVSTSSSLSVALNSAGITSLSIRSTRIESVTSMYASWNSCEQI